MSQAAVRPGCMITQESISTLHKACRVYTQKDVAAGLLDAIGWREDRELAGKRLLEPAAGNGVFLQVAAARLIQSMRRYNEALRIDALENALAAYEIHPSARSQAVSAVSKTLLDGGMTAGVARMLAESWVRPGDFLTATALGTFTHVAGNPPYVRWSNLPLGFRQAYETLIPSTVQRGNLCVPFLYKSVELLEPGGMLAFICSDRWVRAKYGAGLRAYLSANAKTVAYIELHDIHAFDRRVHAYAAVTILGRMEKGAPDVFRTQFAQPRDMDQLNECLRAVAFGSRESSMVTVEEPLRSGPAILIRNRTKARTIRMLEARMPTIEESGCSIRVGAALGHAPAFIVNRSESVVESKLLLPYASSHDLQDGRIHTSRCVINVFDRSGELVDLRRYPGAHEHLLRFKPQLLNRACVRRPEQWYRTIDKISGSFAKLPKILICGIARTPRLALSKRVVQPGNSLYSITSSEWPLTAVSNVLSSGILGLFSEAYSCKVNGDFLRFHGVVLRKLRLPRWVAIPAEIRRALFAPESNSEQVETVCQLYGVTERLIEEYLVVRKTAD